MWIGRLFFLSYFRLIYSQIDVRLPPTVTQDPIRQYNYRNGDTVRLNCKAYGIPEVSYEWKKNGGDLNLNQNNVRFVQDGSGTIDISELSPLDGGYYQCIAKNQYGTAMSNTSFLELAVHTPTPQTSVTLKTVTEGEPFFVQMQPVKSIPPPTYDWESAVDTVDKNPTLIILSRRLQVADNGDLYFAYAVGADDLSGKIYKSTAFNEYLDLRSQGGYTKVTVNRVPGGPPKFIPRIGFSSPNQTIAVEGKTVALRCFFYGNPEPNIQWSGPRNTLPVDRRLFKDFDSNLEIQNVQRTDEGEYVCTGVNELGSTRHKLQIKVEAKPKFLNFNDRPRDTNITEGNSIFFNCKAYAIPEATVTWYRNGVPIDVNSPPKRFSFSNDKKTLTIQNLCRNCEDRPDSSQSDLGIIQCNASNVHGYDFGAGYVNVLTKTQVTILAETTTVNVDMNEEKRVEFDCKATSDPLTPVAPKWYLQGPSGTQLVYDSPPVISLKDGLLVIHVVPNNTKEWIKHQGTYNCTASNNYSSASVLAEIKINDYGAPADKDESNRWLPIVIAVAVTMFVSGLVVFLIAKCYSKYSMRNGPEKDDSRKSGVKRETSNVPHYETIPYDALPAIQVSSHPAAPDPQDILLEDVSRKEIKTVVDDPPYSNCGHVIEYEVPIGNFLPVTTGSDHHGDYEKPEANEYTGLVDRENDYLKPYTDLELAKTEDAKA